MARTLITSGFAGRVRQARGLNTYFNTKIDGWVTRSAKQTSGTITPARLAAQRRFADMVQLVKYACGEDVADAYATAKGTPFLPRDILMKNVAGTLYEVTDQNGNVWLSTRKVQMDISTQLDSISNIPGSMLVRGDSQWMSVLIGGAGKILTVDPVTLKPAWKAASGIIGQNAALFGASEFVTTGNTWTNQFAGGRVFLIPPLSTISYIGFLANAAVATTKWRVAIYSGTQTLMQQLKAQSNVTTGIVAGKNVGVLTTPYTTSDFEWLWLSLVTDVANFTILSAPTTAPVRFWNNGGVNLPNPASTQSTSSLGWGFFAA